jgi:hypothetical protein
VAVFLTDVADVRPAGFEDPQPEQSEHRDQREVADALRLPGGGDKARPRRSVGMSVSGRGDAEEREGPVGVACVVA